MDSWLEVGGIEVDSATCAFADAASLGPEFTLRQFPELSYDDGVVEQFNLVKCCTRADFSMPLEVRYDANDVVVAARLGFVDDLDDIDESGAGKWEDLGAIKITSGRCVACDPFCFSSADCYRCECAVAPGVWGAERFVLDTGDVLGLRLTREGTE